MQRDALRVYDWWRLTGCGHAPSDGKGSRSPFFLWVVSELAPATLHRTVPALLTHRPPHTPPQQTVSSTQSTLWWLSACRTLPTWMLRLGFFQDFFFVLCLTHINRVTYDGGQLCMGVASNSTNRLDKKFNIVSSLWFADGSSNLRLIDFAFQSNYLNNKKSN